MLISGERCQKYNVNYKDYRKAGGKGRQITSLKNKYAFMTKFNLHMASMGLQEKGKEKRGQLLKRKEREREREREGNTGTNIMKSQKLRHVFCYDTEGQEKASGYKKRGTGVDFGGRHADDNLKLIRIFKEALEVPNWNLNFMASK
ncbi:hypothetical protein RUM44_009280 [Polyplax serrata]|uniref:Uncharacterized protein n=1 Tax=Polyplax serrata TaxID=468196 RepID=A0ABR1AS89_POLSC